MERRIGWDELLDHGGLTPDRTVRESRFSCGWEISVNFSSEQIYRDTEGSIHPGWLVVRAGTCAQ